MFLRLKALICAICLACAWPEAQAASWQEHKIAGFNAFDQRDYAGAVEQFQSALVIAYDQQAAAQDLCAVLENLATAYLAAGQPQNALVAMARWDQLLVQRADEPWVPEQEAIRDQLTELIVEALNAGTGRAVPEIDPAATVPKAPEGSNGFAIHLESAQIESNIGASWAQLQATYPAQLAGKTGLVKQVDLGDQGTFFRILAAPFPDSAQAEKACSDLKTLGQYCAIVSLE